MGKQLLKIFFPYKNRPILSTVKPLLLKLNLKQHSMVWHHAPFYYYHLHVLSNTTCNRDTNHLVTSTFYNSTSQHGNFNPLGVATDPQVPSSITARTFVSIIGSKILKVDFFKKLIFFVIFKSNTCKKSISFSNLEVWARIHNFFQRCGGPLNATSNYHNGQVRVDQEITCFDLH